MWSWKWRHSLNALTILVVAILLSACSTYKPSYIHSPTFKEKGELYFEANTGSLFGANIAYSPLNHFFALAEVSGTLPLEESSDSASFVNQNDQLVSEVVYENWQASAALGAYWQYNDELYQSISVGIGNGVGSGRPFNVEFDIFLDDPDLQAIEGSYNVYYLQSSLQYYFTENQSISFNGRINYLNYYDFRYIYGGPFSGFNPNTLFLPPASEINSLLRYKERVVFQLGVTAHYELDFVKFYGQFQLSLQDTYAEDFFRARRYNLFIGVAVPVHKLWRAN
ncbi:MAG: hypothetical protein RIC95_12655 [Vicingaceae bacterium]